MADISRVSSLNRLGGLGTPDITGRMEGISLGSNVKGTFSGGPDEGLRLCHHQGILSHYMRGPVTLRHSVRFSCDVRNCILSWAWILIWREPVSWGVSSKENVIISGGLHNLIFRDISWSWARSILVFNVFNHRESGLQCEYTIIASNWTEIGVIVCRAESLNCKGILISLVQNIAPFCHVLPLLTKSALVLQLFLEEN